MYRFLVSLIRSSDTTENKLKYWFASIEHFSGNHSNCRNKTHNGFIWKYHNDTDARKILNILISESGSFILECYQHYTTNPNEYYHSLKGYYLEKIFAFKSSTIGRISASILQYNCPHMWIYEARRRLGLPSLPPRVFKIFNSFALSQAKTRCRKKNETIRAKTNSKRESKRKQSKLEYKNKNELKHK